MKPSIFKIFYSLSLMLLLANCSSEPTVTSSIYTKTQPEEYTVVSVCYSASASSQAEIMAKALEACPANANTVVPWDKTFILNDCPVVKKTSVTFLCAIK